MELLLRNDHFRNSVGSVTVISLQPYRETCKHLFKLGAKVIAQSLRVTKIPFALDFSLFNPPKNLSGAIPIPLFAQLSQLYSTENVSRIIFRPFPTQKFRKIQINS
jgi:hypothetical protein